MPFDPQTLNNLTMGAVALGAAFIAALWLSLIIWTYRDARSRARDPLLRILAAILVALLFLPGVIIYLLIRPRRTLDEEYHRALEEEALLQSIEDLPVCPGCGRRTMDTWIICPSCHTRLKKFCQQCHGLMELSWNLCPYCGAPTPGKRMDDQGTSNITQPTLTNEDPSAQDYRPFQRSENQEEPLKRNGAP